MVSKKFSVLVDDDKYFDAMIWARQNCRGMWWDEYKLNVEKNQDGSLRKLRSWYFKNEEDFVEFKDIWGT